ncbi:MAG: hypothetical protein PVG70_20960 [Desulfobacterales bacterium]
MITKKLLFAYRIRRIDGGFSFIPHRFLTAGFLKALSQQELLLYIFLVLAADRYGLSFYSYDRICSLLHMTVEQYIEARDGLLEKDLIGFDGTLFQVLSLPTEPRQRPMNTPKRRLPGCQTPAGWPEVCSPISQAAKWAKSPQDGRNRCSRCLCLCRLPAVQFRQRQCCKLCAAIC